MTTGSGGEKEVAAAMTISTLKKIVQSGMWGDDGKAPTAGDVVRMQQQVLFLLMGGCHTLTAWWIVVKSPVRLSHGVVDSDYIGVFREDH